MKEFYAEIKKHIRIYLLFVKTSLIAELEYRVNFILGIVVECAYLATKLLYVFIVYSNGSDVSGLSPDQVMLFIGTFMILTAIYTGFFMVNFNYISWRITRGELDMLIVKPVSLQFHTTMRYVIITIPIPNIIAGVILVSTAWRRMGLSVGFGNILLYMGLILSGTVLTYSLFLTPHILSFWTVKSNSLIDIADRLWDFNSMPMQIYNKWLQRVCMFVIPVFIITNFPVMALFDTLPPFYLIWGLLIPLAVFLLVRRFWNHAVKRYSSAGG